MKDLYTENCKTLNKDIKEDTNKWMFYAHWGLPRGHPPVTGQVLGASTTKTHQLHPWPFVHQEIPFWNQGVTGQVGLSAAGSFYSFLWGWVQFSFLLNSLCGADGNALKDSGSGPWLPGSWLPSLLFVSTSWFAIGPFPPAEKWASSKIRWEPF